MPDCTPPVQSPRNCCWCHRTWCHETQKVYPVLKCKFQPWFIMVYHGTVTSIPKVHEPRTLSAPPAGGVQEISFWHCSGIWASHRQLRKQQTQCASVFQTHRILRSVANTLGWRPFKGLSWLVNSSSLSLKFSTVLRRFSRHSPSSGLLATQCYGLENKGRLTSTTSKDFPQTFRGLPSWPAAASSHWRVSHVRRLRDREFGNFRDFEASPTLETAIGSTSEDS